MPWIYLSPHLDDAVFSCGGLISRQIQAGEPVEIWTLCAGDPPDAIFSPFAEELHARWGAVEDPDGSRNAVIGSVAQRRQEDRAACRLIGAVPRHFPLPDCIYRRPGLNYWDEKGPSASEEAAQAVFLYPDLQSIFGPLHPLETDLIEQVAERLSGLLPPGSRLVVPLTLGGHVDHRLTRRVAERLPGEKWYYADYPYAADHFDEIESLIPPGWRKHTFPLSAAELDAWAGSMAVHRSQISSFWPDPAAMRQALEAYSLRLGGGALWAADR